MDIPSEATPPEAIVPAPAAPNSSTDFVDATPPENKPPRWPLLRFFAGLAVALLALLVLLFLLRGLFIWQNSDSLKTAGWGPTMLAWYKGLRFDIAMVAAFATPLIAIYYLAALWPAKWTRGLVIVYLAAVALISVLISVADIQYFDESGKHMSYEATAYLNLSIIPILKGAFQLRPWFTLLSVLGVGVAGALFAWLASRLVRVAVPRRRMAWWRIAVVAVLYPALSWASGVAERGGFQNRSLGVGDSLISTNPFLNSLCLSPVYSVMKLSMRSERDHPFKFYSEKDNVRVVRNLMNIPGEPADPKFPLVRTSPGVPGGNKHNVVVFLLESWSGKDIGALGSTAGVTPNFDALTKEGIFFDHFYASGIRTAEGIFSVLSSFPNQPLRPVIRTPVTFQNHWRTLSQILHDTGYKNIFVHGRDMDFDSMREFFTYTAFDQVIDRRDFPKSFTESHDAWPGYADADVAKRADDEFAAQGDNPFLGVIYTMNTHPPFVTPDGFPLAYPVDSTAKKTLSSSELEQNKFLNSLKYSDSALKTFFDLAKTHDYFKNTIFVLVADHARGNDRFNLDSQHHIPMLIYAPGIVQPKVDHVTSGQLDIVPTILGLLNLQTEHASWGRDLLSLPPGDEGFAIGMVGDEARWHGAHRLVEDTLGRKDPMLFDLDKDPDCKTDIWAERNKDDEQLQHNLRAIVSLSQGMLYQDRVYPPKEPATKPGPAK